MDEPKITLPPWLPWATTACLAALVACLGELWLVERARNQLLRDQSLLSSAALKAEENQLEAERILGRRELGQVRAAAALPAGFEIEVLSPPDAGAQAYPAKVPAWGVVIWEAGAGRALLRAPGLPPALPERDYQLWLDGPGQDYPVDCGTLEAASPGGSDGFSVSLPQPMEPGCRFVLVECQKGGGRTLQEARYGGSIVLASLPYSGSIPKR